MMTDQETGEKVRRAIEAAAAGDIDEARRIAGDLLADRGSESLHWYDACAAIAGVGEQAMATVFGGRAPDIARGGRWTAEHVKPDGYGSPAERFGVEFLIAQANGHSAVAVAELLRLGQAGPEVFLRGVGSLVGAVALLVRQTGQEAAAG